MPAHRVFQPQISSERCVHSLLETASCRACVDCCPRRAWVLSDDSLGLDLEACDGCGLCVPACNQGAIDLGWVAACHATYGHGAVYLVCEWADEPRGGECIPCVHAIGIQRLLRLYAGGMRHLETSTADCASCSRGGASSLWQAVATLNTVLRRAGREPVVVRKRYLSRRGSADPRSARFDSAESRERRNFLRVFIPDQGSDAGARVGAAPGEEAGFMPPGRLLAKTSEVAFWPHLPSIDPKSCTGCDACVRLCPHDAIELDDSNGQIQYRITPANCTGCFLCVDVCAGDAVMLKQWSRQTQCEVPLNRSTCSACGVAFHVPADSTATTAGLCRICNTRNHYQYLFQRMD